MEKHNKNSDRQNKSQWFWPSLIGLVVIGLTIVSMLFASILNLSRDLLLQFIFLLIGCSVSYWVGKVSVKKAAEEIVKPHAKSAFRRLLSLYENLSRAATVIQSGQVTDTLENHQVTLARLEEIVAGQLIIADDALEDWHDIVPEDIEKLRHKRQPDNTTRGE